MDTVFSLVVVVRSERIALAFFSEESAAMTVAKLYNHGRGAQQFGEAFERAIVSQAKVFDTAVDYFREDGDK